ncbi:MAG: MlaD family protein, partial [Flavobacteriales bacterium]
MIVRVGAVASGEHTSLAVYGDVSGVTGSSPVFFRGMKVGQVIRTQLVPDGSGRIAVSFQIDN